MAEKQEKINVFISYSHKDEEYLEMLRTYLNHPSCSKLNIWDDGAIQAGTEWDETIKKHLNNSQIILLLVSQYFLSSNYINKIELSTALERHKKGQCRVIPIFARYCNLRDHPLEQIQGLPKGMKFLSNMDREIDQELTNIQIEINEIAASLIADCNITRSIADNDERSKKASTIEELRNKKKIFLSLPGPEATEARKMRYDMIKEADAKRNYEDWPYEVVPGIREVKELDKMSEEEQTRALAALLNESIYSIHIVSAENDLSQGTGKQQLEMAKGRHSEVTSSVFRSIVWLLNAGLKSKMEKEILMNPVITGDDFGEMFDKIASLDIEKEKALVEQKKEFFPNKKVYLYYDFSKDHNNDLRIRLKSSIEKKDFRVRFNIPGENIQKQTEDLESCEGALIFYGAAEPEWYLVGQARLLGTKNLRSRAVCIDEPEIDKKMERDVSVNEFVTIRGKENFDTALNNFLLSLNDQP